MGIDYTALGRKVLVTRYRMVIENDLRPYSFTNELTRGLGYSKPFFICSYSWNPAAFLLFFKFKYGKPLLELNRSISISEHGSRHDCSVFFLGTSLLSAGLFSLSPAASILRLVYKVMPVVAGANSALRQVTSN